MNGIESVKKNAVTDTVSQANK
ncbi:MAG: DUF1508 domain-containing protein [Oxalobacter sp.]|nr:DUF1508 domain-containing protein [Oxalobacter sp.]